MRPAKARSPPVQKVPKVGPPPPPEGGATGEKVGSADTAALIESLFEAIETTEDEIDEDSTLECTDTGSRRRIWDNSIPICVLIWF
jgi:hypothetical protein